MWRNLLIVLVAGLFVTVPIAGVVAQDEVQYVRGEPDLNAYAPEPTLTPGTTTQLTLQIDNDGKIRGGATTQRGTVTTARAVTVELRERRAPIAVETKRQSIGSIADGERREVPITVTVPEDAEPGEYTLDVRIRYSHTFQFAPQSGVIQERSRIVTRSVDVTIDDGPRFEMRTLESDVAVGDSGTLLAELRNVGAETANDLTVGLESTTPDMTLGEGSQNAARIERLEPGENATIEYDVAVRSGVSLRELPLAGSVEFTDTDGGDGVQEGLSIGVRPASEQELSVSVNESALRVGETGAVYGTVRNLGPADLTDVVVVIGDAQFDARSPSYSVGDLAAGEAASFRFRGTVPSGADAVPQRIDVETRYRTPADNERMTDDSMRVPVAERRESVSISAIEPQFDAGETGVLELEITNHRDIEIRDVRFYLDVDDPLESEFRSAVIGSLAPGETDRIAFDLEADSDAPSSRYPATIETTYIDDDDEPVEPRPATVAVTVTGSEGGEHLSVELLVFGILLVLVAAAFVWLYRR